MRIDDLRSGTRAGVARTSARLTWEESDRAPDVLWYECDDVERASDDARADAFLLAATPLAAWHGERRVSIAAPVDARLAAGLDTLVRFLTQHFDRCRPLSLEPDGGLRTAPAGGPRRGAAFLSCGVDALAMLREHRDGPPADGLPIEHGFFAFGLNSHDFDRGTARPERLRAYERDRARLTALGADMGFDVVSARTNIRSLYPDFHAWDRVGWLAGLASVAVAFASGPVDVALASDGVGLNVPLTEAQPRLAHLYATESVRIRVAQAAVRRLDKVRLLADWPEALRIVRPCLAIALPAGGDLNCGRCEKCIRTILECHALGILDRVPALHGLDVTPGMVADVRVQRARLLAVYTELIDPLRARGRGDLADAVEEAIRRSNPPPSPWRRWLRRIAGKAR